MVGRWSALLLAVTACSSGALALGRLDDASPSGPSDAATADAPADTCLPGTPTRQYDFAGTGTEVVDTRGGPSGRLAGGAVLDGSGTLVLDGVDDYVSLPPHLLAGLDEVTIATWVRHRGGGGYTRFFDFGITSIGADPAPDASYVGRSYLAATPSTGNTPSGLAVLLSPDGTGKEVTAATATQLEHERFHLVAVVVANGTLAIALDGTIVDRVPRTTALSAIDDANAWLGRSNYAADPYLAADYADFRLWNRALADCAIAALFAAGVP